MTHALPTEYWLATTALNISLNALGTPDYISCSASSGAMIMCYVKNIDGVIGTYDNGHSYRRWSLQAYNTAFNDTSEKYVYVAIPRDANNANALIVFPSVEIDIYGKSHTITTAEDGTTTDTEAQVGDTNYYYIYLHARISSSGDNGTTPRTWLNEDGTSATVCTINTGSLSTDAAVAAAIATIDELLRGMFTPVKFENGAPVPVTNLTDMQAIRANKDFFGVGGLAAYGFLTEEEGTTPGASYFRDLLDVTKPTSSEVGKAWGVASIAEDGTPTYGWIEVGSGEGGSGKTYTANDSYISVNNTTDKIGLNFDTLKTALNIPDVSGMLTTSNYAATLGSVYHPKLEYTPFDAANFIKDNIKSTLGISDWALSANKPSYSFSEITGTIVFSNLPTMYWANIKVASASSTDCAPTMKSITIGRVTLYYDSTNEALKVDGNIYATGGISAYQYGESDQTLVANFTDLLDVKALGTLTQSDLGHAWGVYKDTNGNIKWGLIEAGINSSYLTKIEHGETAYNAMNAYKGSAHSLVVNGNYLQLKDWNNNVLGNNITVPYATTAATATSASKLSAARSLWGNSFNGSSDIYGTINIQKAQYSGDTKGGQALQFDGVNAILAYYPTSDEQQLHFGVGSCNDGKVVAYCGSPISFQIKYNGARTNVARIKQEGNNVKFLLGNLSGGNSEGSGYGGIEWDATNQAFKITGNLYATGGISAYGCGNSGNNVVEAVINNQTGYAGLVSASASGGVLTINKGNYKIQVMTESAYTSLSSKDSYTIYIING